MKLKFTAEAIAKRNRKFLNSTRNAQRVQIAKDVLALLDAEKIQAKRGTYMQLETTNKVLKPGKESGWYSGEGPHKEIFDVIKAPSTTCEVCAIGAVFTAAMLCRGVDGEYEVRKSHDGHVSRPGRDYMTEVMEPYFSEEEMNDLEDFFEMNSDSHDLDQETSLRAAMERLIETNGKSFIPTKKVLRVLERECEAAWEEENGY